MKKITSLESIALGLKDGGIEVFTNFPGYKSHELFSLLGGGITSTNEKIAYEIAWGSSLAGKRSAVMFKNVGLDDAADPFLNSMIVGVNAGLVVLVFDDTYVEGSQSRQDSRNYFDFFKGLWFEPYSVQSAYDLTYKAASLSEKFKLPIVIRITSQLLRCEDSVKRSKKQTSKLKFIRDQERFVVHPVHAKLQREGLEKKNLQIRAYVDKLYKFKNSNSKNKLLIFGCNTDEEKLFDGLYQKIHIYTYPIPNSITKILRNSKKIEVLEQGNNFASEKLGSMLNNFELKTNTGIIPDKSKGYIISSNYEKLYKSLKKHKPVIIGDLGEYTKDNLNSVDAVLSFGSALSVNIGCVLGGIKNVISITGDGSYLHSGKNSIYEALLRKISIKLIVISNGGSQGTGGQSIPGDLYFQPKGIKITRLNYKKTSQDKFDKTITEFIKTKHSEVLYVEM